MRSDTVDDRVACDGVEPRCRGASLRPVRVRRPPDGGEHLLHRILGPFAVAKPPERQPEDRADVAVVERVEGVAVALGDADEQVGVARLSGLRRLVGRGEGAKARRRLQSKLHLSTVLTHRSPCRIPKSDRADERSARRSFGKCEIAGFSAWKRMPRG